MARPLDSELEHFPLLEWPAFAASASSEFRAALEQVFVSRRRHALA